MLKVQDFFKDKRVSDGLTGIHKGGVIMDVVNAEQVSSWLVYKCVY